MIHPLRVWVKLTIRALPRKSWQDDFEMVKSVAIARITGTFVVLTVTMAYYILNAILPALRNLWGISFLVITIALYILVIERILRVVRHRVRHRNNIGNTRS